DLRPELDEELERRDAAGLRRPHERLVEHLLRVVGRLPGREASVRAVEAAVRARRGRAGELPDQVEVAEAGGDAEVAGLAPEQAGDLDVAPEERDREGRPAVPPRRQVGASAVGEQELRERTAVRVAGLVELRPAVVVAAVRVGAPLEEEADELELPGHPEQVVAVRAADPHELRKPVEERLQAPAVAVLDGAVGLHERRRGGGAGAELLEAAQELAPAPEAVPAGELEPGLL